MLPSSSRCFLYIKYHETWHARYLITFMIYSLSGIANEIQWPVSFGNVVSCEDDCFQTARPPSLVRNICFIGEKLTISYHNCPIWVCVYVSVIQSCFPFHQNFRSCRLNSKSVALADILEILWHRPMTSWATPHLTFQLHCTQSPIFPCDCRVRMLWSICRHLDCNDERNLEKAKKTTDGAAREVLSPFSPPLPVLSVVFFRAPQVALPTTNQDGGNSIETWLLLQWILQNQVGHLMIFTQQKS